MKNLAYHLCLWILLVPTIGYSFTENSFQAGYGYYSQNFMNRTVSKDTGETGFMGTTNYLLNLKYDYNFMDDWFLQPGLGYTIFPRSTSDSMAKVTITHLTLLFGQNIGQRSFDWDLYGGPGIIKYDIKGDGGTTTLNNGTGTATFAKPGRTATVQKITSNLGSSMTFARHHRAAFDLIIENILSSSKRTQSFMLSYAYVFGGY